MRTMIISSTLVFSLLIMAPKTVLSDTPAGNPSIMSSSNIGYYEGDNAFISCSSMGSPAPTVKWYRGNTLVDDTSDLKPIADIFIVENRYSFTVKKSDVNVTFNCRVKNSAISKELVANWQLTLLVPVEGKPSIQGPTKVTVGTKYTWKCTSPAAYPATSLNWRLDSIALVTGVTTAQQQKSPDSRMLYTESTLERTVLATDNGQQLKCEMQHDSLAGKAVTSLTLETNFAAAPPSVTISKPTYNFVVGQLVLLVCNVVANPPLDLLTWTRNGATINVKNGRYEGGTESITSLTIKSVQLSDAGQYVCIARNSEGSTPSPNMELIVQERPRVTVNSVSYTQNEGGSVTLNCLATGYPVPEIEWLRNGTKLTLSSRYSGGKKGSPSLTIPTLQGSDTGGYQCKATNSQGSDTSSTISLLVEVRPTVTIIKTSYSAKVGTSLVLNCLVSGKVTSISWTRDNVALNKNSGTVSGGTISIPVLTISPVALTDAGTYKCIAANGALTSTGLPIKVEVEAPASLNVDVVKPAYNVTTGATVKLECIVTATPPVTTVRWLKDGSIVNVDDNHYIGGTEINPSLTVFSVDSSDSGIYECFASNGVVNDRKTIVLSVQSPASLNIDVIKPAYNVTTGATVKLECIVTATPPVTTVRWLKDGSIVNVDDNHYTGGTEINPSLTVFSVDSSDSGVYECYASNGVVDDRKTVVLSVQSLTSLNVEVVQPAYNVTTGATVKLECIITATPPVTTVRWLKDGSIVNVDDNHYTGGTKISPSLTVFSVDNSDSGVYECYASNGVVDDRKTVVLSVQYATIVTVAKSSYNVNLGDTVTLQCSVFGEPPVTVVYWTIDGYSIDVTDSHYDGGTRDQPSLTIFNIDNLDLGVYTCSAANVIGTASKLITVSSGPSIKIYLEFRAYYPVFGQTVELKCAIQGSPPATSIYWTKDNNRITATGRYSGSEPSKPSLFISKVDESDSGAYKCHASNGLDNIVSESISVFVKVEKKPVVTVTQDSYSVNEGTLVVLMCTVTSEATLRAVGWDFNDQPLNTDSSRYIAPSLTDATLTIKSSRGSDSGKYTCKASNSAGETRGRSIVLNVVVFSTPAVTIGSRFYSVPLGQTVTLICTVDTNTPVTKVLWLYNGAPLDISGRYSGGNVTTPSLTISDVNESDGGNYICTATNVAGTTNSPAMLLRLRLERLPEITVNERLYEVKETKDVTLHCSASGIPAITSVRWTFNNQDISMSSSHYEGASASDPSLRIPKVVKTDNGTYQCYATNTVGESKTPNTDIRLAVLYAPTVTIPAGSLQLEREKGESITIPCTVSDSYPAISSLTWYYKQSANGIEKSLNTTQTKYTGGTKSSPALTIGSLVVQDSGHYSCEAANKAGSDKSQSAILTVRVKYAPNNIKLQDESKLSVEGTYVVSSANNVSVACNVDANPTASYEWYLGDKLQQNGQNLQIYSVTKTSIGNYTCKAKNALGEKSLSFVLDVQYAPTGANRSNTIAPVGSTSTSLVCENDANPAVTTYSWKFNGEVIQGVEGKTLSFDRVDKNEFGLYVCTASNSVGTSTFEIILSEEPGEGAATSDGTLSSGAIAAIVLAIVLLLLVIIIIVACLFFKGICGAFCVKKDTKGRVRPQHVGVQVDMDDKKRYFETSSLHIPPDDSVSSDVTLVSKRDVNPVLLPRYGEIPNGNYAVTNGGPPMGTTIISVRDPTTNESKPHKLPPLGGGHEENEVRRLKKKKKKHRSKHHRKEEPSVPENGMPPAVEENRISYVAEESEDEDIVVLPGNDSNIHI